MRILNLRHLRLLGRTARKRNVSRARLSDLRLPRPGNLARLCIHLRIIDVDAVVHSLPNGLRLLGEELREDIGTHFICVNIAMTNKIVADAILDEAQVGTIGAIHMPNRGTQP